MSSLQVLKPPLWRKLTGKELLQLVPKSSQSCFRELRITTQKNQRQCLVCRAQKKETEEAYTSRGGEFAPLDLQREVEVGPQQTVLDYSLPLGQKTVKEVLEDIKDGIENATLEKVGSAAAVSGGAAVALLVASSVMGSMRSVPLLPETMQTVGLVYLGLVVREAVTKERLKLAPSPLATLGDMLGAGKATHLPAAELLSFLPEDMDERVGARLRTLAEERDRARAQLEVLKKKEEDVGRAIAEKEALEAVAMRLAEERDSALSEVTALRTAVNAMTERMKAIEAMLAQEVQRLQDQNNALETVALQLADERDKAVTQVAELRTAFEKQREEDKKVLELLASQLIEERNSALKQAEELKLVVANLMQASGSASGLPAEMEAFIKSRVRAVRAQYLDIAKPYAMQVEAVDNFVSHLVEEYGAPREWTRSYIEQFLTGASAGHALGVEGVAPSHEESKKLV